MTKYYLKLFLFCLLTLGIGIVLNKYYKLPEYITSSKIHWALSTSADSTCIGLIGTSSVLHGINPNVIGDSCCLNFGLPQTSIKDHLNMIRYLYASRRIKKFVVQIDLLTFLDISELTDLKDHDFFFYPYSSKANFFYDSYVHLPFKAFPNLSYLVFRDAYLNSLVAEFDSSGFGGMKGEVNIKETVDAIAYIGTFKAKMHHRQFAFLKKLLNKTESERNYDLIITISPISPILREIVFNNPEVKLVKDSVMHLIAENNTRYIYVPDSVFSNHDFADPIHLNHSGAIKYSYALGRSLMFP